jgi:hypothetical protein
MSTKKKKEPVFSKEALLKSMRFRDNRDIVSAVLEDGVEYTISEVETMITNFMKGKVK